MGIRHRRTLIYGRGHRVLIMFLPRNISRSDNKRKPKAYCTIAVIECVLIRNLNRYGFSRRNVRQTSCKHIRSFLLYEGCFFPTTCCFLKLFFRLFSLLNLTFYNSIPNTHSQLINGSIFRKRKNVDAFYPVFGVVLKLLTDCRSSKYPGHVYFDVS